MFIKYNYHKHYLIFFNFINAISLTSNYNSISIKNE